MRKVLPLVNSVSLGPSVAAYSQNVDFPVPPWATGAVFFINLAAAGGTSPLFDFKLQRTDAVSGVFKDVLGASIVQLTAAGTSVLTVDPNITVVANVNVSQSLSAGMRAVITIDNTTHDETYTYDISVEFYSA
jgi:hypothetical protein